MSAYSAVSFMVMSWMTMNSIAFMSSGLVLIRLIRDDVGAGSVEGLDGKSSPSFLPVCTMLLQKSVQLRIAPTP